MTAPVRRRALIRHVGAGLVTSLGWPWPQAHAQAEFNFKFANNAPPSHPINRRGAELADAVRTETGGRVNITLHPSNQLGGDTELLAQLRVGGIEFLTLSGLILSSLVPVAAINGIGFAFPDQRSVWLAMDGALGAHVRTQIERAGLVPMGRMWDNGFRQITTSTRPITVPGDLRGLKLRVPVSPLWTAMFQAFGAAPSSINFNELYTALQTGLVEGQENALSLVLLARLYEVQRHCALTGHMWDGFWFLANGRVWERLPPALRDSVAQQIDAAALRQRADMAALNASAQQDLVAKGLQFNQPEPAAFRERLRASGFYADWQRRLGDPAWSLLERVTGRLA